MARDWHLESGRKRFWGIVILFHFVFCLTTLFPASEVEVIENPVPTHTETKYVKLELVKEISNDIDDKNFFAKPTALIVDDEGSIFVYDSLLKKILKIDKKYKFERTFGSQGRGPGEFTGMDWGLKKLYFGPDKLIYVCSGFNNKIIAFDKNGKHIEDIRLPYKLRSRSFLPVVDNHRNFYFLSTNEGAVDIYDKKMNFSCTLLDKEDYQRFIFYRPTGRSRFRRDGYLSPQLFNTYYDSIPGDRMIIYLVNSSRVFILKNYKLINHFDVWPAIALRLYKKEVVDEMKKTKKQIESLIPICNNLIPDRDDPRFFYLFFHPGTRLYKFNLTGELIHVLEVEGSTCEFEAKRNGFFYGIGVRNEKIKIYRVKKEKKILLR